MKETWMLVKSNPLLPWSHPPLSCQSKIRPHSPHQASAHACLLRLPGGQPALRPGCAGPASPCTRPAHGKGCSGSWAGPKFQHTVHWWQGKMIFPTRKPLFYVSVFPAALWNLHRHSEFCWIFSSSFKMKESIKSLQKAFWDLKVKWLLLAHISKQRLCCLLLVL